MPEGFETKSITVEIKADGETPGSVIATFAA